MNLNKTWSRNRDPLLKQYTVPSLQRPLDLQGRERARQRDSGRRRHASEGSSGCTGPTQGILRGTLPITGQRLL